MVIINGETPAWRRRRRVPRRVVGVAALLVAGLLLAAVLAPDVAQGILALLALVGALLLYLLPLYVAGNRRSRLLGPVAVVNILLGWTVVGWVAALVMALWPASPASADASR